MMNFVSSKTDPNHPQIHNWFGLTLLEKEQGHVTLMPENETSQKRNCNCKSRLQRKKEHPNVIIANIEVSRACFLKKEYLLINCS